MVDTPLFKEINSLLLVSDQSDSEGCFEEYIASQSEFLQHHESDQDEDSENSQIIPEVVGCDNSEDEENMSLAGLRW